MLKRCCFLIILIVITATSIAQRLWLNGYIKDSLTHFPIAGGTVKNADNTQKVFSDTKGFFRIEVAPNDLIYVLAPSYRFDTLTYATMFADTIIVFLSPAAVVLPGVTVTSSDSKYKMDSMARWAEFEENRGNVMSTISRPNSSAFGIGINLDRFFTKKYKFQRKNETAFKNSEKAAYVDYRFSPQLVAFYTGLKGNELQQFINHYKPDYKWLRQNPSNEAVFRYINEKLKEYHATKIPG